MQQEYPHEIRRFSDGEAVPEGFVEISEEQFRLLDGMAPADRGSWLEAARAIMAATKAVKDFGKELRELSADVIADRQRKAELHAGRADFLRSQGRPAPAPARRREHRRQDR